MSQPTSIPAGANHPLSGTVVTVTVTAASLSGAMILAENDGGLRPVTPTDRIGSVRIDGTTAHVTIDLEAVPLDSSRLRLVAWSAAPTRTLAPARATVTVDGTPTAAVEIEAGSPFRSAEILEIYRRHGAWKVRSIASGWHGHVAAMADALGLPRATFAPATPAPPPDATPSAHAAPPRAAPTVSSTPLVGPPELRPLVDGIAGPGWRDGDADSIAFEIGGVTLRLFHEQRGSYIQLLAAVPLGTGPKNDATAEAALRATAAASLARITIFDDGSALASAVVFALPHQVESALAKALLCDAWVAAARFADRVRPIGWRVTDLLTTSVPRELRLGVAEEMQTVEEWRPVHERLCDSGCLPMADQPAALLAVAAGGHLVVGPALLEGTNRAWAIIVERVLRADVQPRAGLWQALASKNMPAGPVRFGVVDEGPGGPSAITASYAALQIPRTQVLEDLQAGLDFVDQAAATLDGELSRLMPDASSQRNDLPWPAHRRWKGPGAELREEPLVRELLSLPPDAGPPTSFVDRVTRDAHRLDRPTLAYLGHLALQRAELPGGERAWSQCASRIVALAPANGPGAPSATASLHTRLRRLRGPEPRRSPVTPPTPEPPPRRSGPATPEPPEPEPEVRRRRWRIFG